MLAVVSLLHHFTLCLTDYLCTTPEALKLNLSYIGPGFGVVPLGLPTHLLQSLAARVSKLWA